MKAKEVLNGVAMPDDKIVTDGTVTRTVVDSYICDYLTKRHLLNGPNKGTGLLERNSVQTHIEALQDLKVDQLAMEPWRFTTPEERE